MKGRKYVLTFAFGPVQEVSAHHFWLMLHRFSGTDNKGKKKNKLPKRSWMLLICEITDWDLFCKHAPSELPPMRKNYAFYYNSALLTVHIILQQALNCIWSCKIDWETNKWLRALRRHDKDQCVYRIPENSFCIFGSLQRWIWNTSQYDFPESYLQIAA